MNCPSAMRHMHLHSPCKSQRKHSIYMCIFTYPSESINQLSVNSYSKYVNHQYCRPECKTEGTFNVSMYVKVTIIVHVNSTTWGSGRWFSPFMFVKFVLSK